MEKLKVPMLNQRRPYNAHLGAQTRPFRHHDGSNLSDGTPTRPISY